MLKRLFSRKSRKTKAVSEPSSSTTTSAPQSHERLTVDSSKFRRRKGSSEPPNLTEQPSRQDTTYPLGDSSEPESLGLHVIYQPENVAPVDIVFVHGLGGDSQKTWSKEHDPKNFWPQLWLPLDSDIGKARIMTFGYNANFRPGSSKNTSNISDFAKELLYELGFGKDESGNDLSIGSVPILFVVHSMGGLVVKKAYILGQNDERYQDIVRAISGIVFLATPHRGTDLAQTLNRMLMVSFQTPKSFIGDLVRSSPALEDLNELFRHIAPRLSIVSFYETIPTPIGLTKLMVVEKESSTLGYPKEVSRALQADHHEVCKYPHPEHSNYIAVRNALKTLVTHFVPEDGDTSSRPLSPEAKGSEIFAAPPDPAEDFNFFRCQWVPGTCDWLLREPEVEAWLESKLESCVVWLNAPPGSGKSVLSARIINHLQNWGVICQYFFFRFGDQTKSSFRTFLESIAHQIAREFPAFRTGLADLLKDGIRLDQADPTLIWRKLFELILFKMKLTHPLYWVIDALDESDSPKALLELLRGISNSRVPIRLLIVSRKTEPLVLSFTRLSEFIPVKIIEAGFHSQVSKDIHTVVEREFKLLSVSDDLKRRVIKSVMDRANGNFLWVQLILKEIISCRSEDAIQSTLDEVPDDMNNLYNRMELATLNDLRENDRRLATVLFQWVICATRPFTLKELSLALSPEFPEFLNLERTIGDVCGQFILVDRVGRVGMMHQTARDYLIHSSNKFSVDLPRAHGRLFIKTISTLQDPKLRIKLAQGQRTLQSVNPFVFYAATSWMYHLQHSDATTDESLESLMKLFKSPYILTWISLLAYIGQLDVLVKAAEALTTFVVATRKNSTGQNPRPNHLLDLEVLEQWTVDLVEVACKFSRHLLLRPLAIYNLIPSVCPETSILRQQFHQPGLADVLVSGISNTTWSDNLARNSLPSDEQASEIVCAGPHIAVLGSSGRIFVWDSYNFTEICTLDHEEKISTICFNESGSKIVSYGFKKSTKLWSIPSGKLLGETPNPVDVKVIKMVFAQKDSTILSGSDDKAIRYLLTDDFSSGWRVLDPALVREDIHIEGTFRNSPTWIAFNHDATQVGVSYRGFPLSVWGLAEYNCIGRCKKAKEVQGERGNLSAGWSPVNRFTFNPVSGHVIGIYKNGTIFKWHPITGENCEAPLSRSFPHEVAVSPDGKIFITSNTDGVIKIWSFAGLNVIYQLPPGYMITDLTFGPDCRRFYDLRDSTVNAWEPNILTRSSKAFELSNELTNKTQSPTYESSRASDNWPAVDGIVSVLSVAPDNSLYCVGIDNGTVNLFETHTGEFIEVEKLHSFFGVNHLVWAKDSRLVAASSLAHNVVFKRLVSGRGGIKNGMTVKSTQSPKADVKAIRQMLFNSDASLLLLIGEERGQILSVDSGTARASSELDYGTSRRWITHPTQNEFFLALGSMDAKVYRWRDFTEHTSLIYHQDFQNLQHLDHPITFHPNRNRSTALREPGKDSSTRLDAASSVDKAMHTQDGKHLLIQTKYGSTRGTVQKRLLIFNVYDFEIGNDENPLPAMPMYFHIPLTVEASIEYPLGVLSGSRLVFLDSDLWVCTLRLQTKSKQDAVKRHYFIPRGWTSNQGLDQCCLMADGTVLCPWGDKVVVMTGDLDSVGF